MWFAVCSMRSWWRQWCSLQAGWWCSLVYLFLQKKSVSEHSWMAAPDRQTSIFHTFVNLAPCLLLIIPTEVYLIFPFFCQKLWNLLSVTCLTPACKVWAWSQRLCSARCRRTQTATGLWWVTMRRRMWFTSGSACQFSSWTNLQLSLLKPSASAKLSYCPEFYLWVETNHCVTNEDELTRFSHLRTISVLQYSLSFACLKLVNYSFFFWLPFYLSNNYGWKEAEADRLSVWYDVGGIIGE